MNRAERKRQVREDERGLVHGIDPETSDAGSTVAMTRQMFLLFEKAKRAGSIEAPIEFFYDKVAETLAAKPIQVACARGCSHCCNGWVSATAPEILYMASRVRERGAALAVRLEAAHTATHAFTMAERPEHQHPCPILESNACSLYDARPFMCRMAASVDVNACMKVIRLLEPGTIPVPMRHIKARGRYELAITVALVQAGLPHRYYDLTAGLACVLSSKDAEAAWLSGEEIFAGVRTDPTDVMTRSDARFIRSRAFG